MFISANIHAQTQPINVIKFTQAEGLSSYNIRCVAQDKRGFIWAATQNGLNRFDGHDFLNYTGSSDPARRLNGADIRVVIEDTARSLLWVLPSEGGINAISTRTGLVTRSITIPTVGPEEWAMSMVLRQDQLWIGLSTGLRVYNIAENRFEKDPELPVKGNNRHDFEASCLLEDSCGNVWAFYSGYGAVVYDGPSRKVVRKVQLTDWNDFLRSGNIRFFSCRALSGRKILCGTTQGLRMVYFDANYNVSVVNRPCRTVPALNRLPVESIEVGRNKRIVVAGQGRLYECDSNLGSCVLLEQRGDEERWDRSVQFIFFDQDQNCWLGCQQGLGLVKSGPHPFVSFYRDASGTKRLEHVRSIFVRDTQQLLVGLRGGLATVGKNTREFSITDAAHLYHHLWQDQRGRILASTPDGLYAINGTRRQPIDKLYPAFAPYRSFVINSHIQLNDSVVVLGTENDAGILIWNTRKGTLLHVSGTTPGMRLGSSIVNNIYLDAKRRVWVLSDHIITVISADLSHSFTIRCENPRSKKELTLFFDVCEAGGYYWLASYGNGLVQLDSAFVAKRLFDAGNGLSNNGVYQVFPAGNRIVITSDNGLSVFDLGTGKFICYYAEDGLHSSSFEEVAGVVSKGLIYAGGVRGFTIIDPSKFSSDTHPPRIYINRILVDRKNHRDIDTSDFEMESMDVPSDVLQLTIGISAISYRALGRTELAYRIVSEDDNWVSLGAQKTIRLIGLPHGYYTLEVKAANEDGVWSEPVRLRLRYLPKWYEAWWFKAAVAALALAMLYGIYRVRVRQILKEQRIRRNVASDLHDDIGGSLNSLKIFAHLAQLAPENGSHIRNVSRNLDEATAGLRDMIWVLDDKLDSVSDLAERVSQFSIGVADSLGIKVHVQIHPPLRNRKLSKTAKRNLFLILKEAITNSIKYASCRNIVVSFDLTEKKMTAVVQDDGRGFDTVAGGSGYGLHNMRIRAQQIRYAVSIESSPAGTVVRLTEGA